MKTVFLNYSMDCELPIGTPYTGVERESFFHGPKTWGEAERSVLGLLERMDELGLKEGVTLFVYPDVAQEQKCLFSRLAGLGVEIALHLNGLRYSRLRGEHAKWLGAMSWVEQSEALRMAKADVEDATGRSCDGYRACYGSANKDTFPILDSLGFRWSSNSSNRWRPEFHSCWDGSWPFPHRASAHSQLIPGDLRLYEIPVSSCPELGFGGNADQPLDFRVETTVALNGQDRRLFRRGVEMLFQKMERRAIPVRAFVGATHNTVPLWESDSFQTRNLQWLARHVREVAAAYQQKVVPASFAAMVRHAEEINAY